jgi:hypothetical protein
MQRLFAVVGVFVTALAAACGSSSHPKSNAVTDGGLSGGVVNGDGARTVRADALYAPDSGSAAGLADVGSTGGTGSGGTTGMGTGGVGGSDALPATGGVGESDGPTAKGGAGITDGPGATGGAGRNDALVATGGTGAGGTAGTTGTAGRAGTAGRTGTAGTTRTGGAARTAGATGTGGAAGTAGTTGTAGAAAGAAGTAAPADNVAELSVDFGLPGIGYLNGLFANVTVCVPGTSQCQTIDHVLLDTGSSGLRLLASVLTLSLPAWTDDSGVALAECTQFVSSFTWGPLRSADLKLAGEQANGIPIQVIGGSTYPVPRTCTGVNASTADTLGANGILGISALVQDCGPACAEPTGTRSANPGIYFACSSAAKGGCTAAAVPIAKQVSNPVPLFSQDNNGTIIELPTISANGAPSVTGSLVFGIGTRANNDLGQATVIPLDSSGSFLTSYPANSSYSLAFVDSGSNALYFPNSGTSRIATCSGLYSGFYCPRSTLSLSATNKDTGGLVTVTVNFSIANAEALFANQNNVAFNNLGGSSSAPRSAPTAIGAFFDWGLPFYFGRNVFTAIENQSTPSGAGPFVAF